MSNPALSAAALYGLIGKDVKVTMNTDCILKGVLTKISSYDLIVNDGSENHSNFPALIQLDGEDDYTWRIFDIKKIEVYAPEE